MRRCLIALSFLLLASSVWAVTQPSPTNTQTAINNSGGSCTVNVPTGMTNGSSVVIVAIFFNNGTVNPTVTGTPSGTWTSFVPENSATNGNAGIFHYWQAYGGETGTYAFTLSSTNPYVQCSATGWNNASTSTPIGDSATTNDSGGTSTTETTGAVSYTSQDATGTLVLDWSQSDSSAITLPSSGVTGLSGVLTASTGNNGAGDVYQTSAASSSGSSSTYSAITTSAAHYATSAYVIVAAGSAPPTAGAGVFWIP